MRSLSRSLFLPALVALGLAGCSRQPGGTSGTGNVDWPVYGGDLQGTRYSALDQINRENVGRLEPAWVLSTGDRRDDPPSTIECNPIVVNGTMYLTSAFIRVFAVDPENGAVRWVF
ncbi:MAG: pyrroloquinoline quinone-dependent dehydrogenase, partial [Candidatus Glassbacteria bacterium]